MLVKTNKEVVGKKTISYKTFVTKFFLPNIHIFEKSAKRDKIMCYVLENDLDDDLEHSIITTPCIPVKPNGKLKLISEIVEPFATARIFELFEETDERFPMYPYAEDKFILKLKRLGMLHDRLPPYLIVDRALSVTSKNAVCSVCAGIRSKSLVKYIDKTLRVHQDDFKPISDELKAIPFIAALLRPGYWAFRWSTDDCEISGHCAKHSEKNTEEIRYQFCRPTEIYNHNCKHLVSCHCKVMKLQCSNEFHELLGILHLDASLEVSTVIRLLTSQLDAMQLTFQYQQPHAVKTEQCVSDVYKHLNSCFQKLPEGHQIPEVLQMPTKSIILVSDRFITPLMIARNVLADCRPHLYRLNDSVIKGCSALCTILQIQDHFSPSDIVRTMKSFYEDKHSEQLTDKELAQCKNILEVLTYEMKRMKITTNVFVEHEWEVFIPDEDKVLFRSTELCFNDFDAAPRSDTMRFVHEGIPKNVCKSVGVKKKKVQIFDENTDDFEDFYQEEPLVTRIKTLIDAYPLDSGIFKELLQNADDAGATEIHFILDGDMHSCTNLMSKKMKPLQNKSLCVYNNSQFTEKDLIGIRRLGQGSKDDDPSKTGRYGVGFNSVYNLTDAPSFLTKGSVVPNGEALCFFDPLASFIPGATRKKPGKQVKNVQLFRNHYSTTLDGYHEDHFTANEGTMFRFPLRTEPSDISEQPCTFETVKHLLEEFKTGLKTALLFLKNIHSIKVGEIHGEKYTELYKVCLEMDATSLETRRSFTENYNKRCRSYIEDRNTVVEASPYFALYKVDIVVKSGTLQKESYTVSQALGFKSGPSAELSKRITERNIGMMPVAGVACRVRNKNTHVVQETGYNVHCFLPLPIVSGLPVYVHGHFALDHENRRSLWQEKEDKTCFKTMWNTNLIQTVLCPAYVKLFDDVRDEETKDIIDFQEQSKVNAVVNYVTGLLPRVNDVKGDYWKLLTKSVFQELVSKEHPFLPCCLNKIVETASFGFLKNKSINSCLYWLSLKNGEDNFPAYNSEESNSTRDFSKSQLNAVWRDIGMKIVCVDKTVQDTMQEAEVPIKDVTPEIVMDFLCSYDMNVRDGCTINTDVEIACTFLKSIENLNVLIKYIAEDPKYLLKHLSNLPIMLCEDGILRCLKGRSIFITMFSNLFHKNRSLFLHNAVYQENKEKLKEMMQQDSSILTEFTVKEFSKLAKQSSFVTAESTTYILWDEDKLAGDWLKQFWLFFEECVLKQTKTNEEAHKEDCVANILSDFSEFALVPIKQKGGKRLCAPKLLYTLIVAGTFSHKYGEVFSKLDIPTIERGVVGSAFGKVCAYDCLTPNMARNKCANTVARCLNFHQDKLQTTNLSVDDAKTILRYFNDNLPINNVSKDTLKSLRLFTTYTGDVVVLKDFKTTCLIPYAMPKCGIAEIIKRSRVLLIEIDHTLEALMNELDVKERRILDVYIDHILPMQSHMARADFYKHVKYLARYIKEHEDLEKQKIEMIVQMLRTAQFVETTDGLKRVQDLFDIKHPVFAKLCKDSEFLPMALRDPSLRKLMKQLNLTIELQLDHFVRFAHEIASASGTGAISKEVFEKSNQLLNHLCNMNDDFFKSNCIDKLLDIPFVVPYTVEKQYVSIADSISRGKLAPIRGMVKQENWKICWSSSLVFPIDLRQTRTQVTSFLKILDNPLPDRWSAHCKTVGKNILNALQKAPKSIDQKDSKFVMEWIYKSVSFYEKNVDMKTEFFDIPIVYLPERNFIVPAKNIVVQCQSTDEIPPYVMQAPTYYGKYFDTFLKLGAYQSAELPCYSAVLSKLSHGEPLLPKELSDAKKAMMKIMELLRSEPSDCVRLPELFLLCSDTVIRKSTCTIVADHPFYRKRLETNLKNIPFVMTSGHRSEFQMKTWFKKLPQNIRPHFLTDVVKEEIDTSRMTVVPNEVVSKIQDYMHSSLFKEFLLRLARHSYITKNKVEWEKEMESKIINRISNLDIKCVKGINTVLQMYSVETGLKENLQKVSGTELSKLVHTQHTDEKTEIFVQFSRSLLWLDEVKEDLLKFIKTITEGSIDDIYGYLLIRILNYSARREDMDKTFERSGILPYDVKFEEDSISPEPGTYVPKHLHKYLDNSYGIIHDFEYNFIAYLVEDPALCDDEIDDYSPTYIFVRVIRRIEGTAQEHELVQEYEINIGEEKTVTVKAYLLYKFVRKKNVQLSKETSVVLYERESNEAPFVQERSLKDICVEIRQILIDAWRRNDIERRHIVKRLMLKWHPDKNPDKVQLATKVFQYIQHCLGLLESGKQIPEYAGDEEDFVKRSQSSGGSSYWHDRFWQRYRGSYDDDDWYPRGRRNKRKKGSRAHGRRYNDDPFSGFFSEDRKPYHFYSEAKRWLAQADADLLEAERSLLDSESANNWICYKAHQAAEKSLMAAWYAKDANKIGNVKDSHDLTSIACGLDSTLEALARRITAISVDHRRMRYPNTLFGTIPAHAYTRQNADIMTSLAKDVIAHVRGNFLK